MSAESKHECLHEAELAEMHTCIKNMASTQGEMKGDIKSIAEALNNGLKTEVALLKQSNKRLWWFLSSITLFYFSSIVGLAFWVLRSNLTV